MLAARAETAASIDANIEMARNFIPRSPIRRVLIPKRGLQLPYCSACLKPITTQFAMGLHNRIRESWKRQEARAAVRAPSDCPENPGNQAEVGTRYPARVPPPLGDEENR